MKCDELIHKVSSGEVNTAYLFSGEEDFLKEEALKKIISSQVNPAFRSFDLDILYADEADFGTIKSRAETLPFGSGKRVVVLRNLEELSEGDKRKLLPWLESPPQRTCLVFTASKVNLKKGFYRDLANRTESVVFWKLSDRETSKWICAYLKERGLSVEEEALYLIQTWVGNDLFNVVNELEKVSIYVGDRRRIGIKDIRAGTSRVDSIFDLNKALGQGKVKAALGVLANLIQWGEPPNRILFTVSRHLFTLRKLKRLAEEGLKTTELAKGAGIPKFYLKEYLVQAERLSQKDIEKGLRVVYQTEDALKRGVGNRRLLLELMVTSICRAEFGDQLPFLTEGMKP